MHNRFYYGILRPILQMSRSILMVAFLFNSPTANAQYNLELETNSCLSPATGPTLSAVTGEMRRNTTGTTFTTYTPTITATASFTSQAYTNVSGNTTGTGLQFGVTLNSSGTTPIGIPVWNAMNSVSNPSSSQFTGNPYGTGGTEIDVATNYAFTVFTATRPLQTASLSTSGRHLMGQITITFSRPICNPVLHLVGMGGTEGSLGFSTELDLVSTGITLSYLSGNSNFSVNSTTGQINNSASSINSNSNSGAASGSVRVTGNNIVSLAFNVYMRGDGGGTSWENSGNYAGDRWLIGFSMSEPVITGNVFDDANGMQDSYVNGTTTNGSGLLYVNLVDASTGKVARTTQVQPDGVYLFQDIQPASCPRSYSLRLSSTAGSLGVVPPANNLSGGWAHTGTILGPTTATGGSNTGGSLSSGITVVNAATVLNNANFGIDQLPISNNQSFNISNPTVNQILSLNGTGGASSPGPLTGSDAEDQPVSGSLSGKVVNITSLPTNGQLWYNGSRIIFGADGLTPPSATNPFTISGYNPSLLSIKFTGNHYTTTSFTYAYKDASGNTSATPASYTLSWTVALPVHMLQFDGIAREACSARLAWTTATEAQGTVFCIERSKDGASFNAIGNVAGCAPERTAYFFTDPDAGTGCNYYRLRIKEPSGEMTLSNTIVVQTHCAGAAVQAYPNPMQSVLHITGAENGYAVLTDFAGRIIRTKNISGGETSMNVEDLPAGFYSLHIVSAAGGPVLTVPLSKK